MDTNFSFRRPVMDQYFWQLVGALVMMVVVTSELVQHQRPAHVLSVAAQIEALGADWAEMIAAFGCDSPACAAHELDRYALQAQHRSATLLIPERMP
jgi:hypothetical protein